MKPKSAIRSKSDLLPIPAADRDGIALECYLALSTLRAGQGDRHTLAVLTHALVAAHFLLEARVGDGSESRATFAAAQDAINEIDADAVIAGRCAVTTESSAAAIGGLLALYDRQLRRAPRATVARIVAKVNAFWCESSGAPSMQERLAA
ncbi:TPA: hypothetical protein ACU967_007744 [Burkholderia contaminans]|uniref:hypothetical protein n=1 Tax=Burkholderia TaxID=32008 RepID=UPI000754C44F|nr:MULTISPECIES: hypothetical protein [Burkholderia]KVS20968.1 hypothetical protein WK34_23480 [Burkholderia vietnamiensis]MBM6430662.1 hypothetical protein [Burkholderia contaminans]MBR8016481.1 hypothetical protein [Burkholderia vietnamiensis]MCA7881047.1 hypothetical protein [Burkholderia contaminans]MCB4348916.1 hypothetical protein [Burkholderia vietnamiensis]